MPRIPIYSNEVYPNASPVAEQARSAATAGYYRGNTIRQGFNALEQGVNLAQSDYEKRKAKEEELKSQQEIADYAVASAKYEAQKAVEWATQVDKSDPNAGENFMQDYVAGQQDLAAGLTTPKSRQHAAIHGADAFGSMYKTSSVDVANEQANLAVQNIGTIGTAYSDAAQANPNGMEDYITQSGSQLDAIGKAHNVPQSELNKIKLAQTQEIMKSTAHSDMRNNPQKVLDDIAKGRYLGLDGTDIDALQKQADEQLSAKTSDVRTNENYAFTQRQREATKHLNAVDEGITVDPTTGRWTYPPDYAKNVQQVAHDFPDAISASEISARLSMNQTQIDKNISPPKIDDPDTKNRILNKLIAGTATDAEILNAGALGKLTYSTADFLLKWNHGTEEDKGYMTDAAKIIASQKDYIDNPTAGSTRKLWGSDLYAQYQMKLEKKAAEFKASGRPLEDFDKYARSQTQNFQLDFPKVQAELARRKAAGDKNMLAPVVEPGPIEPGGKPVSAKDFLEQHSEITPDTYKVLASSGALNKFVINANYALPTVTVAVPGLLRGTQPGRQPLVMAGVKHEVIDRWEKTQGDLGFQIPVVSGFRDQSANAAAGGANKSQHMHGNALDLDVRRLSIAERIRVIVYAKANGFTGIGVYPNSIHIDIGPTRAWGPDHHHGSIPSWAHKAIYGIAEGSA